MRAAEDMKPLGARGAMCLRDDGRARQSARKRRREHSWADEHGRHVAELFDRCRRCGVVSGGNGVRVRELHGNVVEPAGWASEDLNGDGGARFGLEREDARVDVAAEAARG